MGTEVLRPQDCLVERFRVSSPVTFHGRKHYLPHGYSKTYRKPTVVRTDPKKKFNNHQQQQRQPQEITSLKRWSSADDVKVIRSNQSNTNGHGPVATGPNGPRPVMGQVTILRRGVSLDSLNSKIKRENTTKGGDDLVAYGTERLGLEQPELLPKQIMFGRPADVYAGSAFSVSPCPSSLPLPSFSRKQEFNSFDDSASRDLRRLLKLE